MAVGQPDLDLAEFLPAPRQCVVVSRLEQLTDGDRAKFEAAMSLPNVTNAKIVERFRERGVRITSDSVALHRAFLEAGAPSKDACICGR